MKILNSRSLW